jgi:AraC-like DNA-binding protein
LTVSPSSAKFGLETAKTGRSSEGLRPMPNRSPTPPAVPFRAVMQMEPGAEAGAIVQDDYDLDTPWHVHEVHQLQCPFDGVVVVEDQRGSYLLTRAQAAWIPAGVAHRTKLRRVRSGSLMFSPGLVPGVVPPLSDRVRIVEVTPLMREMVQGAMRWPVGAPMDATGRAYFAALGHLCAEWIQVEAPFHLPMPRDPRLQAAAAYTRDNLKDGDIAAVCRAAGVSERTLRRGFAAEAGMGWDEYRRRARLLAAAAMLSETRTPVGLVAEAVGFESQSAFAKAFRSLTGETPREFRSRAAFGRRSEDDDVAGDLAGGHPGVALVDLLERDAV